MKTKYIIILFLALLTNCNLASEKQTPEAVKKTFQSKYPGENDPDWHIDSHGNFEAHFKMNKTKYRADFSPKGNWIETETSIDYKDLPEAIKKVIEGNFDKDDITEVEKVISASKGTFYDVEFKRKGKNKDIEFRASGEIMN
ncbi:PepSY-like domain-containing protein [uncultured Winogradskyella sp.]|uniref:PepSY-like domain-containing protein n=1 Tax=uncultured Winogradskyella sp. TaxID=395353 RepID=UPI00260A3196|nr:PepSY-like domain-containing protein [uncultured Winogradskyella sp.]